MPKYLFLYYSKRRGWDSNPRALSDKRFSRPPRYGHFDTSPNVLFNSTVHSIICQALFYFFQGFYIHNFLALLLSLIFCDSLIILPLKFPYVNYFLLFSTHVFFTFFLPLRQTYLFASLNYHTVSAASTQTYLDSNAFPSLLKNISATSISSGVVTLMFS